MTDRSRSKPAAGAARAGLLGAALAFLVAGCNSLDARSWNLHELHSSDPTQAGVRVHKRRAAVMSDFEYLFRRGFRGGGLGLGSEDKGEKGVADPYGRCLEELALLSKHEGASEQTWAVQAELFGWLAVDDDYVLSREIAAEQLGPLVGRVGLERVPEARAVEEGVEVAGPAALSDALARVVRASDLASKGGAGGRRAALEEACATVRALELDRAGLRRALALCTVILRETSLASRDFAPLRELRLALARELVEGSLAAALADEAPLVRCAALRASASLPALARSEVWRAALGDPDWEVRHQVLRLVASKGLPVSEESEREAWLGALVDATRAVEGPVEAAACEALGAVASAGFRSLRSEDWRAWWREAAAENGGS